VFEKSMQSYMLEPNKRVAFEEEITRIRDSVRKRVIKELTRE